MRSDSTTVKPDAPVPLNYYATVALAKAARVMDLELCYISETQTYYLCAADGRAFVPDDLSVIQIGDGPAVWVATAGPNAMNH